MNIHSQEYRNYMEHKLAKDFWFMRLYPNLNSSQKEDYVCFPMEWENGWLEEFYKLCEKIKNEIDETFEWVQLKEKFGEARCYFMGYLSPKGQDYLGDFESKIAPNTCFFCGHSANLCHGHWVLPMCKECANDRDEGKR